MQARFPAAVVGIHVAADALAVRADLGAGSQRCTLQLILL